MRPVRRRLRLRRLGRKLRNHTMIAEMKMRRFLKILLPAMLLLACVNPREASAQQTLASSSAVGSRTRVIVALFNKRKHEVREKRGVRREKYKEIRSEAVIRANPESYSGNYEVLDLRLTLSLDGRGRVDGNGVEPVGDYNGVRRTFELRDGRVEGALLTATMVYANGVTARLEGVFINLTSFDSPTDTGHARFGLGVAGRAIQVSGVTVDKFFYERK